MYQEEGQDLLKRHSNLFVWLSHIPFDTIGNEKCTAFQIVRQQFGHIIFRHFSKRAPDYVVRMKRIASHFICTIEDHTIQYADYVNKSLKTIDHYSQESKQMFCPNN